MDSLGVGQAGDSRELSLPGFPSGFRGKSPQTDRSAEKGLVWVCVRAHSEGGLL